MPLNHSLKSMNQWRKQLRKLKKECPKLSINFKIYQRKTERLSNQLLFTTLSIVIQYLALLLLLSKHHRSLGLHYSLIPNLYDLFFRKYLILP
jgi:hypothetical protein